MLLWLSFWSLSGIGLCESPEEVVDLNSSIKTVVFQHYIGMFINSSKQNECYLWFRLQEIIPIMDYSSPARLQ